MIKVIYKSEPTYFDHCCINDSATKDLTIEFCEESTSTEILNEIIRLLKYAGYSWIDRKSTLLRAIDDMVYDGVLIEDTKESQED